MPLLTPRPKPQHVTLAGNYVQLQPLSLERHFESLLAACTAPSAGERFRYLFDEPPTAESLATWFQAVTPLDDPLFFAVVDVATGRCEGRQALMRVTPAHGVIELGSIFWGASMARTRMATEALYLTAAYVFDELGYRRFEWKCDARNEPSRRAALRFGFSFEGVFKQHMIVKGENRDTAWFAMLDHEWTHLKKGYERWLSADNFGPEGQQLERLNDLIGRPASAGGPG